MSEYNGWTNYETWCANLWISNEPWSEEHARELAQDADDVHDLARMLKDWLSETPDNGGMLPDLGCTFAADMLGAAFSEINWYELAEHYWADREPEDDEEEDDE